MSKPLGAKAAARRAETAAIGACKFLEEYNLEADEASKLFESLRDAAKEAKTLAGNIHKIDARDSQPTASAVKETLKQLRTASNLKSAKAAAKEAVNELQTAADAAKRADDVLRSVPGLLATRLAGSKKSSSHAPRKRAVVRATKVVKAVEAISNTVPTVLANVQRAIERLQALDSLKAVADSAVAAERTAGDLETVAALVRQAADSIDATEEVIWPTTNIWVKASNQITGLAKAARENAELANKASRGSIDQEWLSLADASRMKAEECEKEAKEKHDSAIAVEVLLKVVGFFDDHKSQIFERLEECDTIALQSISNRDMLFIAESLPIINGIIHVGSARKQLKLATNWVQENWGGGEAHPRIVLSALLFKYVTDEGGKTFIGQTPPHEKEEIWKRIQERVKKLL